MTKVSTESRINWFHGSVNPNPARKESSCKTTTSTAKPISKGGAKSHILLVTEQNEARRIVFLCPCMCESKRLNGPTSAMTLPNGFH